MRDENGRVAGGLDRAATHGWGGIGHEMVGPQHRTEDDGQYGHEDESTGYHDALGQKHASLVLHRKLVLS